MNTHPYVRVIKAFGTARVGHIFRPTGVYRDRLVRAGFVEIIPMPKSEAVAKDAKAEVQLPKSSKAKARKVVHA